MSLIIKGMEMPKDQPVLVFIWPDGRVFPAGLYKASEWDGVKAVPLPEGHGDLIDRDALRPDIVDYIAGGYGTVGSMCTLRGYSQQKIDNAPTIVPAEGGNADVQCL